MNLYARPLLATIVTLSLLGACGKDHSSEMGVVSPTTEVTTASAPDNLSIDSVAFQRLGAETELVIPTGSQGVYDITMCEGASFTNCVRLYRLDCAGERCDLLHGATLQHRTNFYLQRRTRGDGKDSIYIEDAVWVAFPLDVSFRAVAIAKDGHFGVEVLAATGTDIVEPTVR